MYVTQRVSVLGVSFKLLVMNGVVNVSAIPSGGFWYLDTWVWYVGVNVTRPGAAGAGPGRRMGCAMPWHNSYRAVNCRWPLHVLSSAWLPRAKSSIRECRLRPCRAPVTMSCTSTASWNAVPCHECSYKYYMYCSKKATISTSLINTSNMTL